MKRYIILALTLLLAAVASAACYGNLDVNQNDKFACSRDEDCLSAYVCQSGFCHEKKIKTSIGGGTCFDSDKDGFCGQGSDQAGVNTSKGCIFSHYCDVNKDLDCDDNDPSVHPGAMEVCDKINNSCGASVDDISHLHCDSDFDCRTLISRGKASATALSKTATCDMASHFCVLPTGFVCKCGKVQATTENECS